LVKKVQSGGWQELLAGRHSISLDLFLILPLLLAYEIGISLTGPGLRNAAEVILKDLCLLMTPQTVRYFHWLIAIVIIFCFARNYSKRRPFFSIFLVVLLESLVIAAILGPLLSRVVGAILLEYPLTAGGEPGFSSSILLSLGAGVYEEIVFRFLLLGGCYALLRRVFLVSFTVSTVVAVLLSSVLFSLYHHIGPYAEPLAAPVFLFRMAAGVALGLVFIFRGFGVAVYLHAFYDIFRDIETALRGGD
jgi:membrane protease YdiL (CAAX protease family)